MVWREEINIAKIRKKPFADVAIMENFSSISSLMVYKHLSLLAAGVFGTRLLSLPDYFVGSLAIST